MLCILHKQFTPITGEKPVVLAPGAAQPVTGLYPWAIVSDSTGSQVYVLARDTALLAQKVGELGFTSDSTKPIKIEHTAQCLYPGIDN
eukprot:gene23185-29380_t